ncbi:CDGSH iron-sulfur domain-containing protein [Streptomyces sp. NPDC056144]|uniref:CDGSH iron-sulfur domain-containing protein n=1 Tax=unclassified Streptomyces TaxID=2593676 RepID=UPI0035E362C5
MSATTPDPIRVQPLPEGPLLVEGPAEIVMPDGSVILCERPMIALCTCRRSLRAPFCDTSHRPRLRRRTGKPRSAGSKTETDGSQGAAEGETS